MRKLFRKMVKVLGVEGILGHYDHDETGILFDPDEAEGVQPGDVIVARRTAEGEYKYFIKEDLSPEEERVRNILRGIAATDEND